MRRYLRTPDPRLPTIRPSPREGGMALFIVLVTVLVLTVVIFQLTFTTKIEERISHNRQGFLEMIQALLAVVRTGLQSLETDLMEDLGYASEAEGEEEDPASPLGGPPPDPAADEGSAEEERFDTRHEGWAHLQNEQINDVRVELRILDGESRIDLNHLFEYAQRPEEEEEPEDPSDGPPTPPELPGDPEDPLPEEEEYIPPTPEEIEDAELVLSRLIEALILANQESGFDYLDDLPDPQLAAREIVAWVAERQAEPETRLIRSLEELRTVEGVTWELFQGPSSPEEDEELDDGGDPIGQLAEEFGQMPGFDQTEEGVLEIARPLGLRDLLTTHSTGKLNLNTARPEVIAALLLGIDDIEEAREIALQIDTFLNSYAIEEEEGSAPAGDETEAAESQEFNEFRAFDDLGKVDETWTEGSASEPSTLDLLRESLEPVSAFRSTFFTLRLEAERDGQKLSGTMQAVRQDHDIIVISWEDSDR